MAASPDGRLVGWVDRHGPLRPAGRIAKVVVVDLATGDVVFENHDGMGGGFGDDLADRYEELEPAFLGFDERYAYWRDAEGHGTRMRVDLESGEVSRAESAEPYGALGRPYGAYTGYPAEVDLGHRWAFFGGWLGEDRFYALTRDRFEGGFDPAAPDRSTGFLTECSLATGRCSDLSRVTGTYHVVLPAGGPGDL